MSGGRRFASVSVAGPLAGRVQRLGDGLSVRRVLPQIECRTVGSFVFLDHFGPTESPMDVGSHPHIGLCTLTYLFAGSILHRDSTGAERLIVPGEVNWMVAGRGVVHSERQGETPLHGLQFWVALPRVLEDVEPSFHFSETTTRVGCNVRLVVGSALNSKQPNIPISPETGDFFLLDVLFPNHDKDSLDCENLVVPNHDRLETAVFVVSGSVTCRFSNGEESKTVSVGEMLVLRGKGLLAEVKPTRDNSRIVVFGGTALPEPRHLVWNFCSHNKDKITEAAKRWKNQDMNFFPLVVNESKEDRMPMPGHG